MVWVNFPASKGGTELSSDEDAETVFVTANESLKKNYIKTHHQEVYVPFGHLSGNHRKIYKILVEKIIFFTILNISASFPFLSLSLTNFFLIRTICKWQTFLHHTVFGTWFNLSFRCFSLYKARTLKKNMIAFDEELSGKTVVTGSIWVATIDPNKL